MTERVEVFSFGGGTQSHAVRELIRQGRLSCPAHLVMANTDREASETWEYLAWAEHHRPLPNGQRVEIAEHALATVDLVAKNGAILMPLFTAGPGQLPTYCSNEWKKRVLQRHLRRLGYGPKVPVRIWLGISTDELQRAGPSGTPWCENHYPLLFDVPMRRDECRALLQQEGYPEPPKSSCWMCPFRGNAQWRHLRDQYPDDFAQAVALDAAMRQVDPNVYVHRSGVPLAAANLDIETSDQLDLLAQECDSGYCYV